MEVRSRDASAPELCQRRSQNRPAEHDRVTPKAAVGPAFGSIMLCEQVARIERQRNPGTNIRLGCCSRVSLRSTRATNYKQKGSGTPAGALVQTSAPYGRGSREASRARLSAFHHGACCSEPTPQLSSRTRFLGRSFGGRYPSLPVPVQRQSRRPVIMPAGRLPEAARERR